MGAQFFKVKNVIYYHGRLDREDRRRIEIARRYDSRLKLKKLGFFK